MKRSYRKARFLPLLLLIIIGIYGCIGTRTSRTFTENDIATSVKRVRKIFFTGKVEERKTPFAGLKQTFLKETGPSGQVTCKVYAVLIMDKGAYRLKDKIFLIVDGKAYPLTFEQEEPESYSETSTQTETITAADSSEVSVVTGYSKDEKKIFKMYYTLAPELIEKIGTARQVLFRFYSGPDMITVNYKGSQLKKLKNFLLQSG